MRWPCQGYFQQPAQKGGAEWRHNLSPHALSVADVPRNTVKAHSEACDKYEGKAKAQESSFGRDRILEIKIRHAGLIAEQESVYRINIRTATRYASQPACPFWATRPVAEVAGCEYGSSRDACFRIS